MKKKKNISNFIIFKIENLNNIIEENNYKQEI